MPRTSNRNLSRRERQIMDIIYKKGKATAAEVMERLPDPPSYSAVRAMLRILEEKRHLKHTKEGPKYVFAGRVAKSRARHQALRHLLRTYFDNSAEQVLAALLDVSRSNLSIQEYNRLVDLIEKAGREIK